MGLRGDGAKLCASKQSAAYPALDTEAMTTPAHQRARDVADSVRDHVRYYMESMYDKEWKKLSMSARTSLLNTVYNQIAAALEGVEATIRADEVHKHDQHISTLEHALAAKEAVCEQLELRVGILETPNAHELKAIIDLKATIAQLELEREVKVPKGYDVSMTYRQHEGQWIVRFIKWGTGKDMKMFTGESPVLEEAIHAASGQMASQQASVVSSQ